MAQFDFLFVYEVMNRELESVCLLKCELERRGYSVAVVETWWCLQHYQEPVSASVVVTFALYGDDQIRFNCGFARDFRQMLNLQWEQIYTNADERSESTNYIVTGRARDMMHVAWGPHSVEWLSDKCGVDKANIVKAGHVAMDFLKPRFLGYYEERNSLLERFGISQDAKVALFVSSFSYVGLPDEVARQDVYQGSAVSPDRLKQVSLESQRKLLEWIDRVLPDHPDVTLVYRPHPAEVGNEAVERLESRHTNFRVIRDCSVKQWIIASDLLLTWYSTSIGEMYFSGKPFAVIRPCPVPEDMDVPLYQGCRVVASLESFDAVLGADSLDLPVSEDVFARYYFYDRDRYSYEVICDACESLLNDQRDRCSDIREVWHQPKLSSLRKMRRLVICALKRILAKAYRQGLQAPGSSCENSVLRKAAYEHYVSEMIANNHATDEEVAAIQRRVERVLDSAAGGSDRRPPSVKEGEDG